MARLAGLLEGMLGRTLSVLKWLALPVSLLLFLQWPLRDYFQAYSREANDLGQWLFALYVAAAVTAATRARTHLAVDTLAKRYPAWVRRLLARAGDVLALGPWAVFVMAAAAPTIVASINHWERFPDTGNPGYCILKASLWLMAGAVLASIALGLLCAGDGDQD